MKFIITDSKTVHKFRLPQDDQKSFTINLNILLSNNHVNEIISLYKSSNNNWTLKTSEEYTIYKDGKTINEIEFNNDLLFDIKFKNYPDICRVYIMYNKSEYLAYRINELNNVTVGSSPDNILSCPELQENVAIIEKKEFSDYLYKKGNVNNVYLNSQSVDSTKISIGDNIFINGINIIYMKSLLLVSSPIYKINIQGVQSYELKSEEIPELTPVTQVEKNTKLYDESKLFVHLPRLKVEVEKKEIEIQSPPDKEVTQRTPVIFTGVSSLTMLFVSSTSLITSIVNYTKNNSSLLELVLELIVFGLMFISSFLIPSLVEKWEKQQEQKRERIRQEKYTSYLNEIIKDIQESLTKEEDILKYNNISIETIIKNIDEKSNNIWDRDIFDTDFLDVMLGIGDMPASLKLNASKNSFELEEDNLKEMLKGVVDTKLVLNNVPIVLSIIDNRLLPIIIEDNIREDYIKNIMLQIIYHHSGKDLKIVIITSEENEKNWSYMKSLSHNWDDKYSIRFFATNEDELLELSTYLEKEFNDRKDKNFDREKEGKESYLIVSDTYSLLKNLQLIDKITLEDEDYGFYGLIFANNINNLPSRFKKIAEIHSDKGMIIDRNVNNSEQITFNPNIYPNLDINMLARNIANIPINIKSSETAIPSSVTFLEMLNVGRIEQLNILNRWKENNPTISLKTPIGIKENNKLIELDLHEKYHGPHGLIAGSTGSGKSEFIITFILSMAINYHPDEVQFVLIDYKGGGLAGAFENRETGLKLPHLVGTITNLDKAEMNRTLVSINSELQRRQKLFNVTRDTLDEGTVDIYKYQRLYREGKVEKPLSHLYIISDEFAELKAQQEDFMDELISAARIGRSLGVHLILATQKPSGVVDDQIWSNSRFRICLKVQTTDDSTEMLKRPDAAYITEAGRFYLQIGNDEIFELGQSGWTGAKYIPSDQVNKKLDDGISFLSNTGDTYKEINEEIKKDESKDYGEQLGNVVRYISQIAKQENIHPASLWLDSIPDIIYYNKVSQKYNFNAKPFYINALIGEYDDPSHQKQGMVELPLSKDGNTFIIGSTGSGKTTLLTTIIYSLIINHNSNELNIYIVDLGSERLKLFHKAPQVGDVLTIDDSDKIKFLFYMLLDEKERRFTYYSENNGEYIKDVEKGKLPFPTIIVILNDVEVFKEKFSEVYESDFEFLVRNCAKVGIIFIATAVNSNALGYNVDSFPKRIMLNMVDPTEYSECFEKPPIPKSNKGRGLINIDGEPFEFQVPLIFDDEHYEKNMNYVLNQLSVYLLNKAPKVPIVPEEIDFELIKNNITSISKVPLGVNTNTAQIGYYNFDDLINVISSSSHSSDKKFFNKLIEILRLINNNKIIVLNALENCELTIPEDVRYFDNSYDKVVSVINKNIDKYLLEKKEDTFCILILGYDSINNFLNNNEESVKLDDIILKSKEINNFKFILYDTVDEIQTIEQTEYDGYFKRKNGLWLGKEFENQTLFETNSIYSDATLNNTITIVYNGEVQNIKYN